MLGSNGLAISFDCRSQMSGWCQSNESGNLAVVVMALCEQSESSETIVVTPTPAKGVAVPKGRQLDTAEECGIVAAS